MPKIKTNKSAQKRFKRTKSGKYKYYKAFGRHLLTSKTSKRRRKLRRADYIDKTNLRRVRILLPYS
ncbi:MAG: 50S ribosomal protein L35 [Candidatus Hydrogenedentota bacterium]